MVQSVATPPPLQGWIDRRFPRLSSQTLHHRHIFIVPSLYALTLSAVVLILWIMSVQFLLNLGYMLVFLLVGMVILSMMQTFRNLDGLSISAGEFSPVFAGEMAGLTLNLSTIDVGGKHQIELKLLGEGAVVETIPPDEPTKTMLSYHTTRRGFIEIPAITLRTVYPMGFFVAWSYYKPQKPLLVFPKPIFAPLPSANDSKGEDHGAHEVPGRENIVGVREYQLGDPINLLSWKHLIGRDMMVSKQTTQSTGGKTLLFGWNQTSNSDTETRLSELCGWIITAHMDGNAFGVQLPQITVPVDTGHAHLRRCLEALASF